MSEKRFEVILNEFDEVEYIMDKEMMEDRDFAEFMDFVELLARNKDEIVKENEQLRECYKDCKVMLHEAIEENELLECKNGVYNVHTLRRENEQLKSVVKQLYLKTDDKFLNSDFISEIERLCNE